MTLDRLLIIRDGYAVTDDAGRILTFVTVPCAAAFAAELERRTGSVVVALSRTVEQIAQLLGMHGLTADNVIDFEAQTESAEDALSWAVELAGRCAGPLRDLSAPQRSDGQCTNES